VVVVISGGAVVVVEVESGVLVVDVDCSVASEVGVSETAVGEAISGAPSWSGFGSTPVAAAAVPVEANNDATTKADLALRSLALNKLRSMGVPSIEGSFAAHRLLAASP
jgi:hypothetical protein